MNNTIINSGAGTGKTTFMKNSIKEYLSVQGNKQEDILGITFTNRAGANMKRGLKEFENIKISSLHSYFMDLVEDKSIIPDDYYKTIKENCIQDAIDSKKKLPRNFKSVFDKYLNSWQTFFVMYRDTLKIDNYKEFKEKLVDTESIAYYILKKKQKENIDEKELENIIRTVIKFLNVIYTANYVTWADIIIQGIFIKQNDIKYILVDEFQDLTYIEYLSIITLSDNANFLLLCDQYQGIYQWRNSNFNFNYKNFLKLYPNTEVKTLDTNYRCSTEVARLSNFFTDKTIDKCNRDIKGSIEVDKQSNYITSLLYRIQALEEDKNIAILCQSNLTCDYISNTLKLNGVKNIDHKTRNYYLDIEPIRLFLRILSFYDAPYNTNVLKTLMIDNFFMKMFGLKLEESLNMLKTVSSEQLVMQDYSLFGERVYDYVVFDTETTGLDVMNDDIIQISAIRLDKDLKEVGRFNQYLLTDKDLTASQDVHNITKEKLEELGRPPAEVLAEFLNFCSGALMVGHNVGYDKDILSYNLARHGLEQLYTVYIDTLDLARVYLVKRKSYKLGDLNEELKLGANPNHDSMEDVIATVKLLVYITRNAVSKHITAYAKSYYNKVKIFCDSVYNADPLVMLDNIVEKCSIDTKDSMYVTLFKDTFIRVYSKLGNTKSVLSFFSNNDELDLDVSKVTVCTVHQSKGLEFDNVYYVQEFNSNVHENGKEKTNLDYVVITRARDNFTIYPKCRHSNIADTITKITDMQVSIQGW